jgi:ATP-dependent helicase/nuclease subunit B
MHPTRLERFISCPFSFLLRDLYELRAPEEPGDSLEMDPLEFGTLAHDILQRAYEEVMARDLGREEAQAAVVAAWRECCREAESRGVTGAALSWEVRRELLLEDLLETVRLDPVFSSPDSRPVGVEWRFGEAVDRPVVLTLDDGRAVRFAGRLDRVDATPSGARVIDYKSGGGGTERNRIKERLSVQLPVYRLALRQATDSDYGTISCLYRLVTRRGGFEDLALPEDEVASARRLAELVAGAVELVDAGLFPRTTRQRCEYCDVRYSCGVSAWTRARKREHESLEPVVCLQSAPPEECTDV